MERENELPDVMDLGAATEVTRGAWGDYRDEILMQPIPGLTVD